ncbi:hypothetical protein FS837_012628 [Tulasnella sp. UAMH 9824]|nr:hypothetical protein FS837_012628 [Tulasnella sp. UAMH 9824]
MTQRRTGNDPSKSKKLSRKISPWRQLTRKLQQNAMYQALLAVIVIALAVLYATSGSGTKATTSSASFNSPIVENKTESISGVYEVVETPDRGKGMIARRDIKQGELILTDEEVLRYFPQPEEDPIEHLWFQMANLTWEQVNEVQSLSYPPATPPRGVPLAIMMTNGYIAGHSMALFTKAARMNHACAGGMNVAYNWRDTDGKLYMHALRDINQGEELFTSYINAKAPREARSLQAKMSERWIDQPQSHPAYGKKEAMIVGGPTDVAMKSLE